MTLLTYAVMEDYTEAVKLILQNKNVTIFGSEVNNILFFITF